MPLPVWTMAYSYDRRKHRHRCRCCNRIIALAEPAIMARIGGRKTWAIHEACGKEQHSDSYTWHEVFKVWAFQHWLRTHGLSPTNQRDWNEIEKRRSEFGVPEERREQQERKHADKQ